MGLFAYARTPQGHFLERAGLDTERAERIAASDADLHEAVRLLEQGCAPELLERILL